MQNFTLVTPGLGPRGPEAVLVVEEKGPGSGVADVVSLYHPLPETRESLDDLNSKCCSWIQSPRAGVCKTPSRRTPGPRKRQQTSWTRTAPSLPQRPLRSVLRRPLGPPLRLRRPPPHGRLPPPRTVGPRPRLPPVPLGLLSRPPASVGPRPVARVQSL